MAKETRRSIVMNTLRDSGPNSGYTAEELAREVALSSEVEAPPAHSIRRLIHTLRAEGNRIATVPIYGAGGTIIHEYRFHD